MSHRSPYLRRVPYAIAQGPLGDYVVAPIHAFNPESWSADGNETYPLLKQHGVIATGTKMECLRGELVLRKETKLTRKKVPLDRALELLKTHIEEGVKIRDWSKCHHCYGDKYVFAGRMKIRCPSCGGNGRGMR
jgi:hypothetical protein